MDQKISKIQKKVQLELDESRYEHTQGVMYTAAALAMCYGEDVKKAMIAGLLHDCAKCIPTEEKIHMCEDNHLEISAVERKNPSLLHAKLTKLKIRIFCKLLQATQPGVQTCLFLRRLSILQIIWNREEQNFQTWQMYVHLYFKILMNVYIEF